MSGGKKYPYKYNYSYKDGRPGIIDIPNGLLPSPCKIHIFGPCENPTFTLTQSGKRIATGRIFIKLVSGRKLVIDSDPLTMSIAEYTTDNEFIASRYANSDFETDRIINLPPGDSKIVFTQSGSGVVTAFVEVKKIV